MQIFHKSDKYEITNNGKSITVEKNILKGYLTIQTESGSENFNFIMSNPKLVREIGEMLIEASKL